MKIILPPLLSFSKKFQQSTVVHVLEASHSIESVLIKFTSAGIPGLITDGAMHPEILITNSLKKTDSSQSFKIYIRGKLPLQESSLVDLSDGIWIKHPKLLNRVVKIAPQDIADSWKGSFNFIEEDSENGIVGLRKPQLGALYAVLSHWSVSKEAATIVMPTGTGKTETMLSILIASRCSRLLVVVPSDALRVQISEKFKTLGLLKHKRSKLLPEESHNPIVGILKHKFRNTQSASEFLELCNVVITTSNIVGQSSEEVQKKIAELCPTLFIDEAHHSEAPTWKEFKEIYNSKNILQFTATPFREDEKMIDGKIIFKFPLKMAQQQGYFKTINFVAVNEFLPNKYDESIAIAAIKVLKSDQTGRHVLMARAQSKSRAEEIAKIYKRLGVSNVVELHTGVSPKKRELAKKAIISGDSKVVVCVDMLGEGFDLPELKIAAFHDIRKSLAVTLQLAGRFTRAQQDLGDATFIANLGNIEVKDELRNLYSQDPDWNDLLPELSNHIIDTQEIIKDFIQGFRAFPKDIPLQNIYPAWSTVVYSTACISWKPDQFKHGLHNSSAHDLINYAINDKEKTLVVIAGKSSRLDWANWDELTNWNCELYILYWMQERNLLFINSSNNNGEFKSLARAVIGESAKLISGDVLFRCFADVNRLQLTNIGLSERLGKNLRYTGRMGSDPESTISAAQKLTSQKCVLFGCGYEKGVRASIGVSRKGRVWSQRRSRIPAFQTWLKSIAVKIQDSSIDTKQFLSGTLESEVIFVRPDKFPVNIDWPEEIYSQVENYTAISITNEEFSTHINSCEISLQNRSVSGKLEFSISNEIDTALFELVLYKDGNGANYKFITNELHPAKIHYGSRSYAATDFFEMYPPIIWFVDGSSLEGARLTKLKASHTAFDTKKIHAWDWKDVDLRKESQGVKPDKDSIQFKVINELIKQDKYAVIFDDDGCGEAADIVTIRLNDSGDENLIEVEFYHCKYAQAGQVAKRINDLYEVCGQAQKSIHWMHNQDKNRDLFTHLLARNPKTKNNVEFDRIIVGDKNLLIKYRELTREIRMRIKIFIVQPGLHKQRISSSQLEILSVTENYLMETYNIPFGVISSGDKTVL